MDLGFLRYFGGCALVEIPEKLQDLTFSVGNCSSPIMHSCQLFRRACWWSEAAFASAARGAIGKVPPAEREVCL